jgi:hypothetical protein
MPRIELSDRGEWVLAFPLAGVAADEDEWDGILEVGLGAGVGVDQEWQPLDGGEAAEVQEDRSGGERRELFVAVGDASGRPVGVPALRVLDQPLPPESASLLCRDRSGSEALELDAAREPVEFRPLEPEQCCDFLLGARGHDQPLAGVRPAAKPPFPGARVPPLARRPGRERTQEGELGAVQLPDDRHAGEGAQGGLVGRRQVVQVEQVGLGGARAGKRYRPGRHQPLVGGVVDRGEDAVGAGRPVLIRGLKGNRGGERVSNTQRRRIVDGGDVDAREEARRVRRRVRPVERARGQAYLPASLNEGPAEGARDLRRAAAGKKEQR